MRPNSLARLRSWLGRPRPEDAELRVLYLLGAYPQLSQGYVRAEIACMRRSGVSVEVWSQALPPSPYEVDVPVHRGTLGDAIALARPHVVHCHWLHKAIEFVPEVERHGLPMTVRGHQFEHDPDRIIQLQGHGCVRRIYLFPHFAAGCPPGLDKVRPLTVGFDPELHFPCPEKDRRLVVRTAPGLAAKALEGFVELAARQKEWRFRLALARTPDDYADRLAAHNKAIGSPVEILLDLAPAAAARLVWEAGVYLHTDAGTEPFGMPVGIAEAMATGAVLLVPRRSGVSEFVGAAGRIYDDWPHAERLLAEMAGWEEHTWEESWRRSARQAALFAGPEVFRPLLADWRELGA